MGTMVDKKKWVSFIEWARIITPVLCLICTVFVGIGNFLIKEQIQATKENTIAINDLKTQMLLSQKDKEFLTAEINEALTGVKGNAGDIRQLQIAVARLK